MNDKIQQLLKQIEERGGEVHVSPQLPDSVAEAFLRQVIDCPDCRRAAREANGRSKQPNGKDQH